MCYFYVILKLHWNKKKILGKIKHPYKTDINVPHV